MTPNVSPAEAAGKKAALLVDIFGGHAVDDHLPYFVVQLQEKGMEYLGDYPEAPNG